MYVLKQFFYSWLLIYNKIILKKLFEKVVVHIFTLLLAHFTSKLVNYSWHSESLNNWKNYEIDHIFLGWERFVDFQTY